METPALGCDVLDLAGDPGVLFGQVEMDVVEEHVLVSPAPEDYQVVVDDDRGVGVTGRGRLSSTVKNGKYL